MLGLVSWQLYLKAFSKKGNKSKGAIWTVVSGKSACQFTVPPRQSISVSDQFNRNAHTAIKLMPGVEQSVRAITNDLRYSPNSVASRIVNFRSVYLNNGLEAELLVTDLSPQLNRLTLPVLALFGKYDFVVPPAVWKYMIIRVRSVIKKMVLFNRNGHDPYLTEPDALDDEVIQFVDRL